MNEKNKTNTKKQVIDKLTEDEFSPHNVKVRITTFIDLDVLKELKKYSVSKNSKYQTELNSILRAIFIRENKKKSTNSANNNVYFLTEEKIRKIVREEIKESVAMGRR